MSKTTDNNTKAETKPSTAQASNFQVPTILLLRKGSDKEDTASVNVDLSSLANVDNVDEAGRHKNLMTMVALILRGKKHLVPTTKLSQQLMLVHADKLADLVHDLSNDVNRATAALALMKDQPYDAILKYEQKGLGTKRSAADMLTNTPLFDQRCKTLNDIPLPWFIALLKKHSTFAIDASILRQMTKKSEKNIRESIELVSGLDTQHNNRT